LSSRSHSAVSHTNTVSNLYTVDKLQHLNKSNNLSTSKTDRKDNVTPEINDFQIRTYRWKAEPDFSPYFWLLPQISVTLVTVVTLGIFHILLFGKPLAFLKYAYYENALLWTFWHRQKQSAGNACIPNNAEVRAPFKMHI
jgi:hypothetical protein